MMQGIFAHRFRLWVMFRMRATVRMFSSEFTIRWHFLVNQAAVPRHGLPQSQVFIVILNRTEAANWRVRRAIASVGKLQR